MPPEAQAFLEGLSAFQILIWGGAIIALCVGIYKAWPVIRRFVQTVDALGDLPEVMERIRHQVENDHDTNMRDELTQLIDQSNAIADTVGDLADWQKKHELKSDATIARIERLEEKS